MHLLDYRLEGEMGKLSKIIFIARLNYSAMLGAYHFEKKFVCYLPFYPPTCVIWRQLENLRKEKVEEVGQS